MFKYETVVTLVISQLYCLVATTGFVADQLMRDKQQTTEVVYRHFVVSHIQRTSCQSERTSVLETVANPTCGLPTPDYFIVTQQLAYSKQSGNAP